MQFMSKNALFLATRLTLLLGVIACAAPALAAVPVPPGTVQVRQEGEIVHFSNEAVELEFRTTDPTIRSFRYRGKELLGPGRGYLQIVTGRTQQPQMRWRFRVCRTDGLFAEIAFENSDTKFDIEAHYIIRSFLPGFYQYLVLAHDAKRSPGVASMGQFNACYRVDPKIFTEAAVDDQRIGPMPTIDAMKKGVQVIDATYRLPDGSIYTKYQSSATMDEKHLVHGVLGKSLGLWIIMPSHEHLNGGPEHQELTVHQTDTTPVLLCHYVAGHYGAGGIRSDSRDGSWSKASVPWFVYVNSGEDAAAMWKDAKVCARAEAARWPYPWLDDASFQLHRGSVTGRLVFDERAGAQPSGGQESQLKPGLQREPAADARVILAPHETESSPFDWQQQWRGYRFYDRTDEVGRFTIEKVRPGEYDLYAWGAGRFGRYHYGGRVVVAKDKSVSLGDLTWTMPENRTVLWRIGVPNRSATELGDGDDFRQFGLWNKIAKDYANGVEFTVGKSKTSDWPMMMAVTASLSSHDTAKKGAESETWHWRSPPWQVKFDCAEAQQGKGVITLGIAGYEGRGGDRGQLELSLNGREIGRINDLVSDSSIHRCGAGGLYREREIRFDAKLLKQGSNVLSIEMNSPGRQPNGAVALPPTALLWDALQMEVETPSK
jgi:rhamnogalacturonan endolyase